MASSNWEDRLAPAVAAMPAAKNWEDRLSPISVNDDINLDPTAGMSPLQLGLAGAGKAMTDLGRGIGQKLGLVSTDDIEASRRRDAALMGTGAGRAGHLVGSVVSTLPVAAIPGVNTLAGATKAGAVLGALAPHTSSGGAVLDTLGGAAGGALGNVAGRTLQAGYGLAKSTLQPFFESGRQKMLIDALRQFVPDVPGTVAKLRTGGAELVPGSMPTAAEASGTAGLAQLEKQVKQMSPAAREAFQARTQAQNAARVAAVRGVAGDVGKRDFFVADRDAVANEMYGAARAAGIDPAALTPEAQANIIKFQQRVPESVLGTVRTIAKVNGAPMDNSTVIDGLHWTKMALDGMIPIEQNPALAAGYTHLKNDLVTGLRNLSPLYGDALDTYATMSKPINQMDVGQHMLDKLVPAINDFGGSGGLNTAAYAQALRGGDAVARRVTGIPSATLDSVLPAEHVATLNAVGQDLARSSNATKLAAAPGSDTAQNLISQNIIRSVLGPFGAPDAVAKNTLMRTLLAPAQYAGQLAEPQVLQKIGDTLLDPSATISALQAAQAPAALKSKAMAELLRRYSSVTGGATAVNALTPVAPALEQ